MFSRNILYERVEDFLKRFQILCSEQRGFIKNKSTITGINNVIGNVFDGLEKREHVQSIFLGISMAFICVHHKTLLLQLERVAFGVFVINGFASCEQT